MKQLNNFWRIFEMLWINYDISLMLSWSNNCVTSSIAKNQAATFVIIDINLYIPVATLSTKDNKNLLQQLKSGIKLTINWSKY